MTTLQSIFGLDEFTKCNLKMLLWAIHTIGNHTSGEELMIFAQSVDVTREDLEAHYRQFS